MAQMSVAHMIIVLIILSINGAYLWRSYIFTFTGIDCKEGDSKLFNFVNCTLVKLNSRQKGFSLNLETAEEIHKLRIEFLLLLPRPSRVDVVILNVTNIDGCEFFANKVGFNILQIIRKEFSRHAVFPTACPVVKGTVINVKNFMFDLDNFPPYMPEGSYSARVKLWQRSTSLLELTINGSCDSKVKRNKNM